jgi:hypothetical protein
MKDKVNEIFLGYQSLQLVKNDWCIRDHLCPHHHVTTDPNHPVYIPTYRPWSKLSMNQSQSQGGELVGKVMSLLGLVLFPDWCAPVLLDHIATMYSGWQRFKPLPLLKFLGSSLIPTAFLSGSLCMLLFNLVWWQGVCSWDGQNQWDQM